MTAIYAVVRVGDADRFVLLTMVALLDGFDPIRQLRLVTILVALMTYVVAVKVINLSNLPSLWPPRLRQTVKGTRLSNFRPGWLKN